MSYRIQTEFTEHAPLKEKVLFHAKFLRHFQRRKLDADARGRTNWVLEFSSERDRFTIMWTREPRRCGEALKYKRERLMGFVVIKFSKKDIEVGGPFLVMGEWAEIEREQRAQNGMVYSVR
jgi:hypothetical protein